MGVGLCVEVNVDENELSDARSRCIKEDKINVKVFVQNHV